MMIEWTGNRFLKSFGTLLCVAGLFGQTQLNAQGPGGGGGGPGPQLSLCYVDGTTNCADAVLNLYVEGFFEQIFSSAALSCGGCTEPAPRQPPVCIDPGKVLVLADASTSLPFAVSVPGFPGGEGGGDDVSSGQPVDCGELRFCMPYVCVSTGGQIRCVTDDFSDLLEVSERFATGDPCTGEV